MPKITGILPTVERGPTWGELEELGLVKKAGLIWSFEIDRLTPSQNELARRYRNRHAYAKLRTEFELWIMAGMANGRIPKATGRRKLTITRYAKSKRYLLDRGNLVGGCKPLLDAAIQMGLIMDDKEELLDDHYEQEVCAKRPRTEVEVTDA